MRKKTGFVVSVLGAVAVNIALMSGTAGADDLPWTGAVPDTAVTDVTSLVTGTLDDALGDDDLPWTSPGTDSAVTGLTSLVSGTLADALGDEDQDDGQDDGQGDEDLPWTK
ncbi:hypothetical protein OKJ48_26370 [Streptomyces kunmingensis]|uniref:Uncharacterized protein n=1 Tax=Streptomyces kunmingensis TaxID=68225 RepID=A0ABU6CHR7_9ACTN|nr:hypothetical protein [Streptomyces kunmingensis]MEB3963741.1 hypothetical protein [Streptomyces kunmingensis]